MFKSVTRAYGYGDPESSFSFMCKWGLFSEAKDLFRTQPVRRFDFCTSIRILESKDPTFFDIIKFLVEVQMIKGTDLFHVSTLVYPKTEKVFLYLLSQPSFSLNVLGFANFCSFASYESVVQLMARYSITTINDVEILEYDHGLDLQSWEHIMWGVLKNPDARVFDLLYKDLDASVTVVQFYSFGTSHALLTLMRDDRIRFRTLNHFVEAYRIAIKSNDLETCRMLLGTPTQWDVRDSRRVIELAISHGSEEIMELFLQSHTFQDLDMWAEIALGQQKHEVLDFLENRIKKPRK
jgi:hypothetical protein